MFKLTKLESEILAHRLEASDAIAGCLVDSEICDDAEAVIDRCDVLLVSVERRLIPDELSELDKEILEDCLSGSTWIGCMLGNESDATISRHANIGQGLADRLSKELGFSRIDFPNY